MRLITILIFLLVFSSLASAIEFPNALDFQDYPVTSPSDPLFIEMDEEVYEYIPTTIRLHINDEYIKSTANYIIVGGLYDNEGNIYGTSNVYYPYNGEDVIEFGTRPVGVVGQTPGMYFMFIYTTTRQEEYPDTSPGSELDGFVCNLKSSPPDSDTFCGGGRCTMCNRVIASVTKTYKLLSSSSSSTLPGGFSFDDTKEIDSFYEGKSVPAFLEYSYIDDSDYACTKSYTFRLDATYEGSIVHRSKDWSTTFSSYSDTTAPGGLTQGPAIELITDESRKINDEKYRINVKYNLIADFDPPGSGGVKVEVYRKDCSGSLVTDEVVAAAKAFAAGYKITPGKFEDYTPTHTASLATAPVAIEEPEPELGATFTGLLTDSQGHPLAYSDMQLYYDGQWNKGFASDREGRYSINIPTFNPEEPSRVSIVSSLNYKRDGKNYFLIADEQHANNLPYLMKSFDYKGTDNLVNDISWGEPSGPGWIYFMQTHDTTATKNDIEFKTNVGNFVATNKFSVIYYHLHNAVDFYVDILGANLDYKLPVEVFVRGTKWSQYTSRESQILILNKHTELDSPKRRFVEQHEFSHHVMYDVYGGWPEGRLLPDMKNHAGYINPSTADSYTEGFAEFFPMVIADYSGMDNPHIYGGIGSLEINYRTSSRRGRMEEYAVAGVLWDLYDKNNDRGDTISLDLSDIWSVISVKRTDFYDYYKAFIAAFPEKKAGIDAIFIEHGFFADKNQGNGLWDHQEPFKDANNNGKYDKGETFVDYGSASGMPAAMFYDVGETIGKASDYNRLNRGLEGMYPDSYLKVSEQDCLLYTVSIDITNLEDGDDFSYTTIQSDGLIYIHPLPDHIEATITVEPGPGYSGTKYETTNSEYSNKLYSSDGQGYFDEHVFSLTLSGESIPKINASNWGYGEEGGYDGTEVKQVTYSQPDVSAPISAEGATGQQPAAGSDFTWLILLVILIAAVTAFIFMKKRPVGIPVSSSQTVAHPQTVAPTHSEPSKFCHVCGRRIEPGQKYCRECGSLSQ